MKTTANDLQEEFEEKRDHRGRKFYTVGRSFVRKEGLRMYFNSKYKSSGACEIYTLDFGLSDYENRIASLDYFFSAQHEAQDADAGERNFLYDLVYLTKDHVPIYAYPGFNPYLIRCPLPLKGDDKKYFRWHNDFDLLSNICNTWISIDVERGEKGNKRIDSVIESMAPRLLKAIQEGIIRDCYAPCHGVSFNYLMRYGRPIKEFEEIPFRSYPQELLDFVNEEI